MHTRRSVAVRLGVEGAGVLALHCCCASGMDRAGQSGAWGHLKKKEKKNAPNSTLSKSFSKTVSSATAHGRASRSDKAGFQIRGQGCRDAVLTNHCSPQHEHGWILLAGHAGAPHEAIIDPPEIFSCGRAAQNESLDAARASILWRDVPWELIAWLPGMPF